MLKFALTTAAVLCVATAGVAAPAADNLTTFGEIAWKQSVVPIRPGGVNGQPFWNGFAKRFIWAPSFDFKPVTGADKYEYRVHSEKSGADLTFAADEPTTALSPVWDQVPVGFFTLEVLGVKADGTSVGLAGKTRSYRAAPFNGPYNAPPPMTYDESARTALRRLLHEPYVDHWLTTGKPDSSYVNYRYPSKIWGALVVGAVTQVHLTTGTDTAEANRSLKLARVIADALLAIRYPDSEKWAGHVATYDETSGYQFDKQSKSHMNVANHLVTMGVDAGNAFLDLYNVTKDAKYVEAAKKIAETYVKTQRADGTWPLFVVHKTGEPVAPNLAIPTAMINYFDRLAKEYGVKGLEESKQKALEFTMEGPAKTFDWQGQFEDVKPREPYENHSREQACELAMYLFRNKQDLELAKDCVRFAEDQFVIWEQPRPLPARPPKKGTKTPAGQMSKNWITPSVQEQYVYWMPVGRSAGIMVETYQVAYEATGDEMYLAKSKSIANSFLEMQRQLKGDYQTFFTRYPMPLWLNSTVYPAKVLMGLQKSLSH